MYVPVRRLVAEEHYHQDRVGHVERHYAFLAKNMGGIARKTALMRDKGDKLVKTLQVSLKCTHDDVTVTAMRR